MRLVCLIAVLAFSGVALGDFIYVQPLPADTSLWGDGLFSDAVPGQYYDQLLGDSFVLGADASVNAVTFWGCSEYYDLPDLTNMESFTVRIYDALGGTPLVEQTALTADTNPVDVGVTWSGATLYEQVITLPSPLALLAGTTYYVTVGATITDIYSDAWVWQNSELVDDTVIGELGVGSGAWSSFTGYGDLAFALTPEPGSLALLGLAVLALRRR